MSAQVTKLKQKQETAAAYQFTQLDRNNVEGKPFWIPKSQVEHLSRMREDVSIKIPEWLADAKGVEYY